MCLPERLQVIKQTVCMLSVLCCTALIFIVHPKSDEVPLALRSWSRTQTRIRIAGRAYVLQARSPSDHLIQLRMNYEPPTRHWLRLHHSRGTPRPKDSNNFLGEVGEAVE